MNNNNKIKNNKVYRTVTFDDFEVLVESNFRN